MFRIVDLKFYEERLLAFVCRESTLTPFGKSGAPQQKFRCTVETRFVFFSSLFRGSMI